MSLQVSNFSIIGILNNFVILWSDSSSYAWLAAIFVIVVALIVLVVIGIVWLLHFRKPKGKSCIYF